MRQPFVYGGVGGSEEATRDRGMLWSLIPCAHAARRGLAASGCLWRLQPRCSDPPPLRTLHPPNPTQTHLHEDLQHVEVAVGVELVARVV